MEAGQKAIDSYGQKGNKEVWRVCYCVKLPHICPTPALIVLFCHTSWQFLGQYGFTLKDAQVEVDLRFRSDVTRDLALSLGACILDRNITFKNESTVNKSNWHLPLRCQNKVCVPG